MTIKLEPQLEQFVQDQACRQGLSDPSDYVNQILNQEKEGRQIPQTSGTRQWIERIRGTATSGLTTDQIMEMTRSEK